MISPVSYPEKSQHWDIRNVIHQGVSYCRSYCTITGILAKNTNIGVMANSLPNWVMTSLYTQHWNNY